MIIELDFRETNKEMKNSRENLEIKINLSKKRRDIVGVHQRAADSSQRL